MNRIAAIVSTSRQSIDGGAPIFYADNEQHVQELALKLEKILDASAHDLGHGCLIIVARDRST